MVGGPSWELKIDQKTSLGAPGGHLDLHEGSRELLGAPPFRKVSKNRGFCEVENGFKRDLDADRRGRLE